MNQKIMLIDGNSIINRAFYGVPLLTNKDGLYTNAVYGFLNILFKLIDEEAPSYIGVCFDLPAPTFRHEKFPAYKGTRKGMPEELRPQLGLLKELLEGMNIKAYELPGFEADDLLGTLCRKSLEEGLTPVIISGDRDLLQIATDTVKVRIPKTKAGKTEIEDFGASDVLLKYGVTPKEFIEVKALMGDSSDNVPGVPGIGEKTAVKIIQAFKTVENAIENAALVTPKKASENLTEYKEQAILSKELVTIITDAPVDFKKEEAAFRDAFNDKSFEMFKRLEFKSHFSRFENNINKKAVEDIRYGFIEDKNEAVNYIKGLKDTVSYALMIDGNTLIGVSFGAENDRGTFIKIEEKVLLEIIKPFFESEIKKAAHDAKRDIVFLARHGIRLLNLWLDTMIAGYILDSTKDTYEYNDLAIDFLNESYPSLEELFGKGKTKKSLKDMDGELISKFACAKADVSFRAGKIVFERLIENNQEKLYFDIEQPLIFVLADMEQYGIKIDEHMLVSYGEEISKNIERLTEEIYSLAGEEFNINSPKQISVVLFGKLGLKGGKKTKTGYSTNAAVLEDLKPKNEIVAKILDYRAYVKLKSTYVDGLLSVSDKKTNKIYSTFNQTVTATGRISSTEPNLQNIPIRTELGRGLRKCFIPTNGDYIFVDADYSQIELRLLAHLSKDETLINAFIEGQDIHRLTASQVFHIPFESVDKNQRAAAKAVNFGIVYGIGGFSLGQDLGITKKEADRYIEGYFQKYPSVKVYLDEAVLSAKKTGYAETIFGRRRLIPELSSSNFNIRSFGERVAMNMPVQGSAADIIKIAMIKVSIKFKEKNLKSKLILQVHDELLVEAHKEELGLVKEILKNEMENAVKLSVPFPVEINIGENWYEAH